MSDKRQKPSEPPDADPHVGWCGRGERVTAPPMPILGGIPGNSEKPRNQRGYELDS
jgi:hypothetical protein